MKYQLPKPEIEEVPTCSPAGYTADQMHVHYAIGYAEGKRSAVDMQDDEDFWTGVCESLDMELFGWRVSFNEGKTWTFWETDPQPSAFDNKQGMIVLPIYVKKYEHGTQEQK